MFNWIWENLLKPLYDKYIWVKLQINKEIEIEKIKNPKKYALLELEKILWDFNWHEHILDKAKEWEWRTIQIKWWKTIHVKKLDEETKNYLLVQIYDFEKKLKKWHQKNKILNKCSKELENAYWDVYNFFEKDRSQVSEEDIIKFFLRRKELLEKIWEDFKGKDIK